MKSWKFYLEKRLEDRSTLVDTKLSIVKGDGGSSVELLFQNLLLFQVAVFSKNAFCHNLLWLLQELDNLVDLQKEKLHIH